jgi:hypothetical protein
VAIAWSTDSLLIADAMNLMNFTAGKEKCQAKRKKDEGKKEKKRKEKSKSSKKKKKAPADF